MRCWNLLVVYLSRRSPLQHCPYRCVIHAGKTHHISPLWAMWLRWDNQGINNWGTPINHKAAWGQHGVRGREGGRLHLNQWTLVPAPVLAGIRSAEVSLSMTLSFWLRVVVVVNTCCAIQLQAMSILKSWSFSFGVFNETLTFMSQLQNINLFHAKSI